MGAGRGPSPGWICSYGNIHCEHLLAAATAGLFALSSDTYRHVQTHAVTLSPTVKLKFLNFSPILKPFMALCGDMSPHVSLSESDSLFDIPSPCSCPRIQAQLLRPCLAHTISQPRDGLNPSGDEMEIASRGTVSR